MLAYVELIQRKEKEIGCDVLTHQKWSGASYVDRILSSKCNRKRYNHLLTGYGFQRLTRVRRAHLLQAKTPQSTHFK